MRNRYRFSRARRWLRPFNRSSFMDGEDGVASVGAVIWVPFFVGVITLAVDASLLMLSRGDMWRVAGETSRLLAIGAITADEAQNFVRTYAVHGDIYTVDVTTTDHSVATTLTAPINMISVSAWFTDSNGDVSVSVAHRLDT